MLPGRRVAFGIASADQANVVYTFDLCNSATYLILEGDVIYGDTTPSIMHRYHGYLNAIIGVMGRN